MKTEHPTTSTPGSARRSALDPEPAPTARAYILALVAVLVMLLVRWLLNPAVGLAYPYATVYFAVAIAGWYGGLWPALLATALGAVGVIAVIVSPGSIRLPTHTDHVGFYLYLANGLWLAVLSELLHRSRRRMWRSETHAIERYDDLIRAHRRHDQVEERYRLLVENQQDYAVILLDPIGRVTAWNRGAERLFGYDEAEIAGQHFSLLFTSADMQAGRPMAELDRARDTGRASDDTWLVRKNGEQFWASGVTTPLTAEPGFAKVVRDLTPMKRVEDELRSNEERYRKLVAPGQRDVTPASIAPTPASTADLPASSSPAS